MATSLKTLHKRVFVYDSSEADEKYFRQRLIDYLKDKAVDSVTGKRIYSLTGVCHDMTWVRNNGGQTLKYRFFNERAQRAYLDRTFFEWAKQMCDLLSDELEKLKQFENPSA